ncbi:hypothetical protein [Streptomyces sp. NPDC059788]|uniref:hypothetical protein n=1 Tax=Streptomyces sp. NPDC059788 TaxID=3346948 RepID=UPI00366398B4
MSYAIEVTEDGETYRPASLRRYASLEDAEEARTSFLTMWPEAEAEIISVEPAKG